MATTREFREEALKLTDPKRSGGSRYAWLSENHYYPYEATEPGTQSLQEI